jgi:hypothetical protein
MVGLLSEQAGNLPGEAATMLLKTKGVKKKQKFLKISLDKNWKCGTLSLVEKCAPTQSGRFAFLGDDLPLPSSA